jgi:hypothetical protein
VKFGHRLAKLASKPRESNFRSPAYAVLAHATAGGPSGAQLFNERSVAIETGCLLASSRYFYTARAADHLQHYIKVHQGRLIVPTLKITDEPYGQEEEAVREFGKQLVDASKPADWC